MVSMKLFVCDINNNAILAKEKLVVKVEKRGSHELYVVACRRQWRLIKYFYRIFFDNCEWAEQTHIWKQLGKSNFY